MNDFDRAVRLCALESADSLKALFNAMQELDPPVSEDEYTGKLRGVVRRLQTASLHHGRSPAEERAPGKARR